MRRMGFESLPPPFWSTTSGASSTLQKAKSKFSTTQGLVQGRARARCTPLPSSSPPPPPAKPEVWLETIYKLKSSVINILLGLFFLVCFHILTTELTKSPKKIIQVIIFPVYVLSTSKILGTLRIFYKEQPPCQTPLTANYLLINR